MTKSVSNLFSILPLARKLLALSTFKLIIQLCVYGLNSEIIVNYKSVIWQKKKMRKLSYKKVIQEKYPELLNF